LEDKEVRSQLRWLGHENRMPQ